MDANARTPRALFDGQVCYEIPTFQRPYVWTEEDQWQPLWDDVQRVTEAVIEAAGNRDRLDEIGNHFLGAVVLNQLSSPAGDPTRRSVIDGQQRLTTLQLLLDAAQLVTEEHGHEEDAESLQELVFNGAKRFSGKPNRFKLWPSRNDRDSFEAAMDNSLVVSPILADSRIVDAHNFFQKAIRAWAELTSDPDKVAMRLAALAEVLQQRLQVVAIDLDPSDDDQLIFETLNDRGTPLLQADLIKNFLFQQCEDIGADVDAWNESYWGDFDGDWWRGQVAQGRLYRSRIDLFLQYWLTMRLRAEIPTDAVFARFKGFAKDELIDTQLAESFLAGLRSDADVFRDFTQLDPESAGGKFYFRVVEALELGAFIPLLLWMISDNHAPPADQVTRALGAVESWVVRRTLLRRTMKDVNKLVVSLLQEVDKHPAAVVGDATVEFLLEQTAESRQWPTDQEVLQQLPSVRAYGNIKQQRLRAVFGAIELNLRHERNEAVPLPAKLEIEHVMPQGWRTYWGADIAGDLAKEIDRDHLVNTLGNLTLVTQKLHGVLSHRPWLDSEAAVVAPTGKDAGVGKRSLLNRYSLLVLNKDIVDPHELSWTEDDIRNRSHALAEQVTAVWPHG